MKKQINIRSVQDTYPMTPQSVERDDMELVFLFDDKYLNTLLDIYDLHSFSDLKADLIISVWRKNGLHISGNIKAEYAQKCVVSLKPISVDKVIDIDQKFLPAATREPGEEIEIDISEETPYEFEDNHLDLINFILESFALDLDLYPRLPDAVIEKKYRGETDSFKNEKPSPFAVLKNLKKPN